jgi:tetratricopeptide (TPR) repeat protein
MRSDVDYGVEVPADVLGLKAEVQLRTVAEHAYCDFAHDLTYKGAFPLPLAWQRELAGVAATLEEVDAVFARVEEGLRAYASSHGAYLTEEQMRAEIAQLRIALEHDSDNAELADRIASLSLSLGEWAHAVELLSRFVAKDDEASTPPPVLRDLGIALCRLDDDHRGAEFTRGQRYLELASAPEHGDVDAVCSYASTWRGIDDDRARELYRRAFELDPANPGALGSYLELELGHNPGLLASARPLLEQGIERCRRHVAARINLPWAMLDLGRFLLLLDEPYEALDAYARAILRSNAAYELASARDSLEHLTRVVGARPAFELARRLLLLGLAARYSWPEAEAELHALASPDATPLAAPVVIVAGGTDPRLETEMRSYTDLLAAAFSNFEGTVLSGGTTQGISGIIGDIGRAAGDRIRTVGYLPALVPNDASKSPDYDELRQTAGHGFSPLEPLQNWIDLFDSGIPPGTVRLLGVNGGRVAATEYRIALALGATVGLVAESGREAGRLLADPDWTHQGLVRLPTDTETLTAFLGPPRPALPEATHAALAQGIHESYRQERLRTQPATDPALSPWECLPDDLRASNLAQADDIAQKLRRIDCTVVAANAPGPPAELSSAEVELLAEMEHGRWNAERLLAGWSWGEERDPERRTNPYLVSWVDLPEEIKEFDRQAVRNIPDLLATVGLSIQRNRQTRFDRTDLR